MNTILAESPWMTIVSKADKTVEINIEGTIGGSWWDDESEDAINTKEQMRAELKAIGAAKADAIIVNINSYGGDVNHGISIHDMLAQHKAKVHTRINGFTASIATVIAMAGDTREISSNSLFLIHKPSFGIMGGFNENDMDSMKEKLAIVDKRIRDIYTKRGVDTKVVDELMEEDGGHGKWLDADEALAMGFVDEVYEPHRMAACVNSPELLAQLGISEIPKNHIDMSTENSTLKSMFDELKQFIAGIVKPAAGEGEGADNSGSTEGAEETIMVAPKELNDKMEAMQAAIDAVETGEQAVADLAALNTTHEATLAEVETLKAENATFAEKVKALEAKLTKLNGGSTKVEGPEGKENPDNGEMTAEQKALANDLASLRSQLTATHE